MTYRCMPYVYHEHSIMMDILYKLMLKHLYWKVMQYNKNIHEMFIMQYSARLENWDGWSSGLFSGQLYK